MKLTVCRTLKIGPTMERSCRGLSPKVGSIWAAHQLIIVVLGQSNASRPIFQPVYRYMLVTVVKLLSLRSCEGRQSARPAPG